MSQPAKAQEPSMEEILASIRRIIADEEPGKSAAEAAPAPPPAAAPSRQDDIDALFANADAESEPAAEGEGDVFDLTEDMTAEPEPAPSFRTIDGEPDVVFAEPEMTQEPDIDPEPQPEPLRSFTAPRPAEAPSPFARPLLSNSTTAAVDSAFNTLAHTVLVQNARTLEDLVKEMLRPMLKSWLDDNLPGLVERLVRAEIERVSRGR